VCTAAQAVHALADAEGARRFLAAHNIEPGQTYCRMGVAGGYSIENVAVDLDHGQVDLLTGSIADGRDRDGPTILADLVHANPWIGRPLFGGSGAVPLRRPYDRLAVPGLALLGNAACQVFSNCSPG